MVTSAFKREGPRWAALSLTHLHPLAAVKGNDEAIEHTPSQEELCTQGDNERRKRKVQTQESQTAPIGWNSDLLVTGQAVGSKIVRQAELAQQAFGDRQVAIKPSIEIGPPLLFTTTDLPGDMEIGVIPALYGAALRHRSSTPTRRKA